jgi:hypothetical protein
MNSSYDDLCTRSALTKHRHDVRPRHMSAAKSPSGHPDPVPSPKTGKLPCRLEHNIERPVALERAWWPGQAAGQHHGEASGSGVQRKVASADPQSHPPPRYASGHRCSRRRQARPPAAANHPVHRHLGSHPKSQYGQWPGPRLDTKFILKFYYAKKNSPSHQNAGKCIEY